MVIDFDEDGDTQNWIEIYSRGEWPVLLGGMSLSDDESEPGKWFFPPVVLAAGRYLVVFASDKDRAPADGGGYSLVIADPGTEPSAWGAAEGWRASTAPGGSPGAAD